MKRSSMIVAAMGALAVACGTHPPAPVLPPPTVATPTPPPGDPAAADTLGPRPAVATPGAFKPPAPIVYTATNGVTVWLIERHALPIVSLVVSIPTGAASDPRGKGGVAKITAQMLDEGAGTRSALDVSRDVDALGAQLATDGDADSSWASMTVLKRNLGKGFAILGDVVARPRFEAREWKRVHDLWTNSLKARASDADATARVIFRSALFGNDHPYGHPWDGTSASAKAVTLDDVKSFYASAWRPERATVIAVGDVTKEELAPLIESAFATWKSPAKSEALPIVTPAAPKGPWPRVVLVDRPDAPQSVIAVVRPGVAASDPDEAPLARVNLALGGSFTSRINQDLREEHGWSYGARSRVAFTRGVGQIVAWAGVFTDKTGEALKALLDDIDDLAKKGLTLDEIEKTRWQARAEMVEAYESVGSAAGRLAQAASLGLGPDYDARASVARDVATGPDLNKLAAKYFDPREAIVVVVGPRAKIEAAITAAGLPAPQLRDADGNVLGDKK